MEIGLPVGLLQDSVPDVIYLSQSMFDLCAVFNYVIGVSPFGIDWKLHGQGALGLGGGQFVPLYKSLDLDLRSGVNQDYDIEIFVKSSLEQKRDIEYSHCLGMKFFLSFPLRPHRLRYVWMKDSVNFFTEGRFSNYSPTQLLSSEGPVQLKKRRSNAVPQGGIGRSPRFYGLPRVSVSIQDYCAEFPESICHGCFPGGNAAR